MSNATEGANTLQIDHDDTSTNITLNEGANKNQALPWNQILPKLKYNEQGLVPAIAQQQDTKEVLMMAWMNRAAIEESLTTGFVCYWSRSRQQLWRKGEQSGQRQQLIQIDIDCDGDTLLLTVNQEGPACHTGRRSCFYNRVDVEQNRLFVTSDPLIDPSQLYSTRPE